MGIGIPVRVMYGQEIYAGENRNANLALRPIPMIPLLALETRDGGVSRLRAMSIGIPLALGIGIPVQVMY